MDMLHQCKGRLAIVCLFSVVLCLMLGGCGKDEPVPEEVEIEVLSLGDAIREPHDDCRLINRLSGETSILISSREEALDYFTPALLALRPGYLDIDYGKYSLLSVQRGHLGGFVGVTTRLSRETATGDFIVTQIFVEDKSESEEFFIVQSDVLVAKKFPEGTRFRNRTSTIFL